MLKPPPSKEQVEKTLQDMKAAKDQELAVLRLQLKKAREEGSRWTTYTNVLLLVILSLLAVQATLVYKSFQASGK